MRLIINGFDIELEPDEKIARTLQVNDILTLSNRQSNYTNTYSIRRTDKNKQTFDLLGVVGIVSFIPYQLNEVYLYTDDGECIVHKGRAVVQSTDKDYKINIYDGNIDLYKAIENKSLGDLNLSEIDHVKTLATVVNTFTANLNYKYIVADFNGKMIYNTNRINIDYLVPSAKVSYLWNKIFSEFGFTYEGSVFNTVDFTNFWLSFPKVIPPQGTPITVLNTTTTIVTDQAPPQINYVITQTGTYFLGLNDLSTGSAYADIWNQNGYTGNTYTLNNRIFVNGVLPLTDIIELQIGDVITTDYIFDETLNLGEYFFETYAGDFQYQFILEFYQGQIISFSNELKDFSAKDFIAEVLNKFGLTPFKNKYTNHYKFLTLQELLQDNDVIDWSREENKFVEKISERYIFGSYAQENNFTYKYNDPESDHYNGDILIENVNLADSKNVVNSKVYAPEKDRTILIHDLQTNVYKMWNKEIKDNGDVVYKGLQKRYYFLREASHTFTTTTQIGSESAGLHQNITTIPVETFYNLRMEDIIRNYYGNIGAILNYSKIIDATIYLNESDIANIDFSKLYWIKQLSSYFILNKVNNFTAKGITKVELIKVDYAAPNNDPVDLEGNGFQLLVDVVKNAVPRLHFGFNQREITARAGSTITIYQDTIYNADMYSDPIVTSTGGTVTRADLNIIEVSFATTGAKTLSAMIANLDRSIELESNVLNITII
jgi:hypothetical protein